MHLGDSNQIVHTWHCVPSGQNTDKIPSKSKINILGIRITFNFLFDPNMPNWPYKSSNHNSWTALSL